LRRRPIEPLADCRQSPHNRHAAAIQSLSGSRCGRCLTEVSAMSIRFSRWLFPIVLLLAPGSARADAIDGNWCHTDGRRFTIRGPAIVTPGGNSLQGNYERHYFSYPIPAAEPRAGETVFMTLMGEYLVHLRVGGEASSAGPVEEWNRCGPSISGRGDTRAPV